MCACSVCRHHWREDGAKFVTSQCAGPEQRWRTRPLTPDFVPAQDPFADKTVYKDNPLDRLFIRLFTKKMAAQLSGACMPLHAP